MQCWDKDRLFRIVDFFFTLSINFCSFPFNYSLSLEISFHNLKFFNNFNILQLQFHKRDYEYGNIKIPHHACPTLTKLLNKSVFMSNGVRLLQICNIYLIIRKVKALTVHDNNDVGAACKQKNRGHLSGHFGQFKMGRCQK